VRGWIFVALSLAAVAVNLDVISRKNPGLLRARLKPIRPERRFDKAYSALSSAAVLALFVVAGLGARWGWSHLDFEWVYAGIALYALGMAPVTWAMATNPYLETTVRIQRDRGHVVIDSGPYAIVRNPMYAGLMVAYAGMPLILGSLWAGYEQYAWRTRARLFPRLW